MPRRIGALHPLMRLEHRIGLRSDWNLERMGIAIVVERRDTGEVLEATARYPLCSS
jgi:hypothetical protein